MTLATVRVLPSGTVVSFGENTAAAARSAAAAAAAAQAALAASGARPFLSTAAGLAGVSPGETFYVVTGGLGIIYRKDEPGPVATEVSRFIVSPQSGAAASLLGVVSPGAGAVARPVSTKLAEIILASDFGVVGDDSTDNAAGINAALAYAHSIGGGDVLLPGGFIRHGSTIDIKYPRVRLIGRGGDYLHDAGVDSTTRTALRPTFAGTAVKLRTPYAAERGIPVNQAQKFWYAGVKDLIILGGGVATKALEIDSVSGVDVRVFATGIVGTDCFEVKCGQSTIDLGEACDVQYSNIWLAARLIDTAPQRACNICRLSGSAGPPGTGANVSLNRGPAAGITISGQHWDGHALVGASADNNDIAVQAFRVGGTGKSIYAQGPTASAVVGFEDNTVVFLTGAGGAFAEGTDTAGVTAGVKNVVLNLDIANASPLPTAGTGSYWDVRDSTGLNFLSMHRGAVFADDPNVARAERALLGSGTVRIRNGSENHAVLTDGTNAWSVSVIESGDLRFLRLAGAGELELGSNVSLGGNTISAGANDSAGAGFRALRIPNA